MKQDVYSKINDLVIEGLTKEGLSWFKPWGNGESDLPYNYNTKRYYSGMNVFMLNAVMRGMGYEFNQWATYKQISTKGGQVKRGEKATDVYYWSIGLFDNKTGKFVHPKMVSQVNTNEMIDGKPRYRKTFTIKLFKVFNVGGQCEGLTPDTLEVIKDVVVNEPITLADELVQAYVERENNFKLANGGGGAFYSPSKDYVNMPKLETFVDSDSYYKTLFHELAHSTGHESRLNRKTLTDVANANGGKTPYAQEELVAEISSMYLVGLLGLDPKDSNLNSQAYIQGWCKHLTDKPRECVYAMQQATKVIAYIQG